MSDDDQQTVYVVVNGNLAVSKNRYHTQEDCHFLQNAKTYSERALDQVPHREECASCAGEWSPVHDRDKTYECDHCGREFTTQNGHSRHVLREHAESVDALSSDPEIVPDGGKVQACPSCDSANLKRRKPLSPHSDLPASASRYRCEDCDFTFDSPKNREDRSSIKGLPKDLLEADKEAVPDGGRDV